MKRNNIQLDPIWLHHHGGRQMGPFEYEMTLGFRGAVADLRRAMNRQAYGV